MFNRLLVPLDGSHLAESVIPAVNFLQQKLAVSVSLVHIVEKNAPTEIHGQHHLANEEEAETYLKEIAQKSFPTSAKVNFHVHTAEIENVAKSITDHVEELDSDLIVIGAHRPELRDYLLGPNAGRVVRHAKQSVLVVRD